MALAATKGDVTLLIEASMGVTATEGAEGKRDSGGEGDFDGGGEGDGNRGDGAGDGRHLLG